MEAALTCLAVAHDQGLQYVHTPFLTLQHSVSPARANEFLGLDGLSHCWPRVDPAAAAPRCGKCAPTKLEPGSPYAIGSKYIIEETGKQCSESTSRDRSFLSDPRRYATCDDRTIHCKWPRIESPNGPILNSAELIPTLTLDLSSRRRLPLLRLFLVHHRAPSPRTGLVPIVAIPSSRLPGRRRRQALVVRGKYSLEQSLAWSLE